MALRRANAAAPQSIEARDYLGNLLWQHRTDEMPPYARDLTNQGYLQTSSQWALGKPRPISKSVLPARVSAEGSGSI